MKQYLLNILTLSLACGLLDMLTPAGEREGLRRGVRLLAGLCLLCVMIRPLTDLRDAVLSLDLGAWARGAEHEAETEYERLMEQKLTAVSRAQLHEDVLTLLCEQLGIARENCTLTLEMDDTAQTLTVRRVWIVLHGSAVLRDPREISAAVEAALGCECIVSVG